MIERIHIEEVATFRGTPVKMDHLNRINLIFGTNATGKTTISRIIDEPDEVFYPRCKLTWKNQSRLETFVYNRDFIDQNVIEPAQLKGVFTIGEKNQEIEKQIDKIKEEIQTIDNSLKTKSTDLETQAEELEQQERKFANECWDIRNRLLETLPFREAFEGYMGSKAKLKDKVLLELKNNTECLVSEEDLKQRAGTIFGEAPTEQSLLSSLDKQQQQLLKYETDPLLKKTIIGSSDVNIAELIDALGNSDWVKQGRSYYDPQVRICPFCQQETDTSLEDDLNQYFDESFTNDLERINSLYSDYEESAVSLQRNLQTILNGSSAFLDIVRFRNLSEMINVKVSDNFQRIMDKSQEPSQEIQLNSLNELLTQVSTIIETTNRKIQEHNTLVQNFKAERQTLISQIWRYFLDVKLPEELASYCKKKAKLEQDFQTLKTEIAQKESAQRQKQKELIALEKQTTSIQPTIEAINKTLRSFDFTEFILVESKKVPYYEIQRPDGKNANRTLSEGERSFIAFLYFYHLANGSLSERGVSDERIVVFDDPVSSLDSKILFIVSTLIREFFKSAQDDTSKIKQVFALTHNVYFFKNIAFIPKRQRGNYYSYWVIKKDNQNSTIVPYPKNPIKSTLMMLFGRKLEIISTTALPYPTHYVK